MRKLTHEEVQMKKPSPQKVMEMKRKPIYVILDNIRSLYNVGSFFRTSDGAMVEKIFLCGFTGFPPRKEISKTALDAEKVVPWEQVDDAFDVIMDLKEKGVQIVAVELCEGSVRYDKADYDFPVCFVFGHEVEGVSDRLMEFCDMAVEVPMLGRANSLNVASCYAIIVYDALRKLCEKEK